MKLKTFTAPNLQDALSQVKKELGDEAVILSTRKKLLGDGNGGRRRTGVEVTAALDPAPALMASAVPDGASLREVKRPDRRFEPAVGPWGEAAYGRLQIDLNEVKDLLLHMVRNTAPPQWLQAHPELVVFYRFLLRTGVDEGFVATWLQDIQGNLAQANGNGRGWKSLALTPVMAACEVINPFSEAASGLRVWTVIGPTGVGKTTTLAKLAAHYALVQKQRVGLVSLDNYRLGAQGQIEAFARIMGVPLVHAASRDELVGALTKFQALDLVLVDTPGRSPHHPGLDNELRGVLGGLPGLLHHLVVSATTKEGDLEAARSSFGGLGIASLMVTKLDETNDFSGVFNVLRRSRMPVSFLATGQRVPEDLEIASTRRLAELLLNSSSSGRLAGTERT